MQQLLIGTAVTATIAALIYSAVSVCMALIFLGSVMIYLLSLYCLLSEEAQAEEEDRALAVSYRYLLEILPTNSLSTECPSLPGASRHFAGSQRGDG